MAAASAGAPTPIDPGLPTGQDARKLTIYFGERTQSASGAYLADGLLAAFGRHEIATSILLRSVEGFGIRHYLRSDRSLSLSDDPPLVAVAVDTTRRVETLIAEVEALRPRGLVTVERARLRRPGPDSLITPATPADQVKLTVYVGRQQRVRRTPAFVAITDLMHRRGLAGATVLLGVDGTTHGARHRARFFDGNGDVPMMIIAVGDWSRIAPVIAELSALRPHPILTVERVQICKRDGELIGRPERLPDLAADGLALWQKIMVYTSESTLHQGKPVHRELVRRLRAQGVVRGATALRGLWGFHGDHRPAGDRFLQVRRSVPVTTIVVDEPERIAAGFGVVDEITAEHGLVTSEMVPALVSVQPGRRRGGFRLARHDR